MNRLTCFNLYNNLVKLDKKLTNYVSCICCLGRVSAQQRMTDISALTKGYA